MTKYFFAILLSLFLYSVANSQNSVETNQESNQTATDTTQNQFSKLSDEEKYLIEYLSRKHAISTRWNDFEVAKSALYDLILRYPTNDSLLVSLASMYYENGKYPSTILVCKDLLERSPKSIAALELSGMSFENLSLFDKALLNFESQYLITNRSEVLYKMAFLQLKLKRYQEALNNADILLSRADADTFMVVFNDSENNPKEYAMKVALLNLKGLIYMEQSDKENAIKFFKETLTIAPDFLLAKESIEELK